MQTHTYGWRRHATGSCSPTGEHRDIHLLNGAVKQIIEIAIISSLTRDHALCVRHVAIVLLTPENYFGLLASLRRDDGTPSGYKRQH